MGFFSRIKTSSAYFRYEDEIFKPAFLAALSDAKEIGGTTEPFDIAELTWARVVSNNADHFAGPMNARHLLKYFCIQTARERLDLLRWSLAVFFVPKFYEIGQGHELAQCWNGLRREEQLDGGALFNALFETANPNNYARLERRWNAPPFSPVFRLDGTVVDLHRTFAGLLNIHPAT